MPKWTTDLPDTSGLYLHTQDYESYENHMTNIVRVMPINEGKLAAYIDGKDVSAQLVGGMWYGPIETPPVPERKIALVLNEGMPEQTYKRICNKLVSEGYTIQEKSVPLYAEHENIEIRKIAEYISALAKVSLVCAPRGYAADNDIHRARVHRTVVGVASMYNHITFRSIDCDD